MPELPEVETLVRRLREPVIGRTIENVTDLLEAHCGPACAEGIRADAAGLRRANHRSAREVSGVYADPAHAERNEVESKHAAVTPTLFLLIHLKMSGKLSVVNRSEPIAKHDRVVFDLDDGRQLRFNDIRKFGKMWLVADPEMVTGAIGPEPLDRAFTLPKFRKLVQSRSGTIKPLLLNQTFVAGVGNIYADESLWLARIHPQRKTDSLAEAEVAALYRSIRKVLRTAIADEGTDAGDGIIEGDYRPRVYGRTDKPCYRCHQLIHRIVVGQRGTHFCPQCQPKRGPARQR